MSEVKVNKISPRSGTTITLGDSGDTFTVPSGVTFDASSGGLAGTLTTAAQPNITSVGTLTSFTSTGIDDNATSTAITIDSSQNVGIGTTNTQGRLLIRTNTSGFTADASLISSGQISFSNSSGGTALPTIMGRSDNNGGLQLMGATSNAPTNADLYFDIRENDNTDYATTTGYGFRFSRYGNELMRLTRDGKLGIGTSSPAEKLHVSSGGNADIQISPGANQCSIIMTNAGATNYRMRSDNSPDGLILGTSSIDAITINSSGNVGIGTTSPTTELRVIGQISTQSNTNQNGFSQNCIGVPANYYFDVRDDGTGIFRIISNRRIQTNGTTNRTGHLNLIGEVGSSFKAIVFEHTSDGGEVGTIKTTSSSTSYNTSSDYRLKENVSYDFDATTRLKQLKPARFNFISDADTTVDGFLAHEVSSVVPEAISGTKDALQVWEEGDELPEGVSVGDNKLDENGNTIPEYQGIDQSKLVPLLVKTIQELEARITQLENN